MDSLTRLLDRYREHAPRRAQGGLYALSGFAFQIDAYLADFVDALVAEIDLEAPGLAFAHALEAFSDSTREEAGHTVCVQAKRTLNRKNLTAAAAEFVAVDAFLESAGEEDLRARVRYEAVGERADRDEGDLAWDRIELPAKAREGDPGAAARWAALRGRAAVLPPRVAPDRRWHLLATAWPHLEDPFAFYREALDLCAGRGLSSAGAAAVRDRIAEAFTRRRRPRALERQELLRPERFAAPGPSSREVVVGRIPRLTDLAEGRFLERPERVAAALADLDRLLERRPLRSEPWLDLFWIDGRSGSGKSVLLLQMARTLVAERGEAVFWLDDRSDRVTQLIEDWPRIAREISGPAFLVVDDLYDNAGREALDLRRLTTLVATAPEVDWPVLLTCGPPEFREAFEADARGEGFKLHSWQLSPTTPGETARLVEWYEEHTGRKAHRGRALAEAEGLLVSQMFEMRYGDLLDAQGELTPFAHRFRERLELGGLAEALRLALAVNRLYIWAPEVWLSAEARDALDRVNEDGDFSVLLAETRGHGYLKLTHPHLSDAVYRALRRTRAAPVFARDLAQAFGWALDGEAAIAGQILRAVADGHERLAALDGATLVAEMVKAWLARPEAAASFGEGRQALLWSWWARWAEREPEVERRLGGPTPFERCRAALLAWPGLPAWRRIWLSLWTSGSRHRRELAELARGWLALSGVLKADPPDWSFLWEELFRAGEMLPAAARKALLELGCHWLKGRKRRPDWAFVWRAVLDNRSELTTDEAKNVLTLGWSWCQQPIHQDRDDWSHVWQAILEHGSELTTDEANSVLALGWSWCQLARHHDRDDWAFVWRAVLEHRNKLPKDGRQELFSVGARWLTGREERKGWAFVWEKLIEVREELPPEVSPEVLVALGCRWALDHLAEPQTPALMAKLLAATGPVPVAASLGGAFIDWLANNRTSTKAPAVWRLASRLRYQLREGAGSWGPPWEDLHELFTTLRERQAQAWQELAAAHREKRPTQARILAQGRTSFLLDPGLVGPVVLPHWEADPELLAHPGEWIGREVDIWILAHKKEERKIWITQKSPDSPLSDIPVAWVGEKQRGTVHSISDTALLVRSEGGWGLLHRVELESTDGRGLAERFRVGDEILVKVVRIHPPTGRICFAPVPPGLTD